MSVFHGPQSRGALRRHRDDKRAEAEDRNAKTPEAKRRAVRRAANRLAGEAS